MTLSTRSMYLHIFSIAARVGLMISPGPMYQEPWVQKLIQQIQHFLQAQAEAGWLDIDQSKPQRILDYACGNGTVSSVRSRP